jgi:hypothetical protein
MERVSRRPLGTPIGSELDLRRFDPLSLSFDEFGCHLRQLSPKTNQVPVKQQDLQNPIFFDMNGCRLASSAKRVTFKDSLILPSPRIQISNGAEF